MLREEHADGIGKQGAVNTTLRGRKQGEDMENL
jgi:hypothetical protein